MALLVSLADMKSFIMSLMSTAAVSSLWICKRVIQLRRSAVIVDLKYVLRRLSDENERSAEHEVDGNTINSSRRSYQIFDNFVEKS